MQRYHQSFVGQAPVVLVCCADLHGYFEGIAEKFRILGRRAHLRRAWCAFFVRGAEQLKTMNVQDLAPAIAFNVAIAVEHIVLRALDLALGKLLGENDR